MDVHDVAKTMRKLQIYCCNNTLQRICKIACI